MKTSLVQSLVLLMATGTAFAADPTAASLSRRELLAAAFPAWQPGLDKTGKPAATMIDAIEMPDVRWPWIAEDRRGNDEDPATTVQIVPMNVTRLDDTHAVLTTWALPAGDDQEAACDSYYCRYALGTYFFALDGERWKLSRRIDVAATPYGSKAPKVRVEAWPGKGFVLAASQPHCHGGYCVEHLTLLGLSPGQLLFEFESNVSKDGSGDRDCGEVEQPSFKLPPDSDESVDCEEAQGKWRIDGDAIRIDFAETSRRTEAPGHLGPLTEANYFARLKPSSGKLQVVEGKLGDYGL